MVFNNFSLSFSGGGCRAYSMTMGALRSFYKHGIISKINIITAVSGSSWINSIIAYTDDDLDDLLGFNICDKRTVDVMTKLTPEFSSNISFKEMADGLCRNFIIRDFNITEKKRDEWPKLIIGSSYDDAGFYYHVEFTEENTLLCPYKKFFPRPNIDSIICSSSTVGSFNSYNINLDKNEYSMHDGCYVDLIGISPLLRRKEKKIFALLSTGFKNGAINIDKLMVFEPYSYDNVFHPDDWHSLIEDIKIKINEDKIAYVRRNMRIQNHLLLGHESYTTELILFVPTKVSEFSNTLPKSNELKNFPNFSVILENAPDLLALTPLQAYSNILFIEWCIDRIIKLESDFFQNNNF